MFEWVKARVLKLMRVPHEPEAPLGAPGSVRVFRAGLNHYRLRVVRWVFGQAGALIGIGFSLVALGVLDLAVDQARRTADVPTPSPSATLEASPGADASPDPSPTRSREERRRQRDRVLKRVVANTPGFVLPLIKFLEVFGIAIFALQMLVTYAIVRLEFEQHWYIVTDRSLRIRTGILRLQESTMSFANIQQVEIRQGPLQRLLGLADVCVRSAGGGDPAPGQQGHAGETSLHLGVFQGVENAVEIRDLVLVRLRRFRQAGLGDPEDARSAHAPAPAMSNSTSQAAEELLAETRALRDVLLAGGRP